MTNGKKFTMFLGTIALALVSVNAAFAQTYYGSQLMTPQERAEHWTTMRSLPPGEREAYRAQHHEEMKKQAESMGLSLPDQPPAYGRGFTRRGPGYGYGRWGRGYWGRGAGPRYWGPDYDTWGDGGWYGPGYGRRGAPVW